MKRGFYLRLVCTGIASLLLVLAAYEMTGKISDWFGVPFLAPGMLTAAIIFPTGVHSDHPDLYIQFAMVFSFFLNWILLLIILKLTGALTIRLKANIRDNR
jgi:hypothetical protein